jgi:hypothetical protein
MWGLREVKNQASTLGNQGHEREPPVAKKSPSFCTNAHMCTREGNGTGPNRKSNANDFHLVNPPIAMLTYMPGMFTALYNKQQCILQPVAACCNDNNGGSSTISPPVT